LAANFVAADASAAWRRLLQEAQRHLAEDLAGTKAFLRHLTVIAKKVQVDIFGSFSIYLPENWTFWKL
jgi:hypothetical protein